VPKAFSYSIKLYFWRLPRTCHLTCKSLKCQVVHHTGIPSWNTKWHVRFWANQIIITTGLNIPATDRICTKMSCSSHEWSLSFCNYYASLLCYLRSPTLPWNRAHGASKEQKGRISQPCRILHIWISVWATNIMEENKGNSRRKVTLLLHSKADSISKETIISPALQAQNNKWFV